VYNCGPNDIILIFNKRVGGHVTASTRTRRRVAEKARERIISVSPGEA
jgi:hypothetical protein